MVLAIFMASLYLVSGIIDVHEKELIKIKVTLYYSFIKGKIFYSKIKVIGKVMNDE